MGRKDYRTLQCLIIIGLIIILHKISYASDILELIKKDSLIIDGNVGFVACNGMEYVISVGVAEKDSNDKAEMLKCYRIAKMISEQNLSEFMNCTKLSSTRNLEIKKNKIGNNFPIKSVKFEEKIRTVNSGELKFEHLGSWYDDVKKNCFCAIGIKLN